MKKWRFIGTENINCIAETELEQISEDTGAEVVCLMSEVKIKTPELLDIVLNEQYAWYGYWVTEDWYIQAGGYNQRLEGGRAYELLARLADCTKVVCIPCTNLDMKNIRTSDFYTDAYLLSRYAEVLKSAGYFETYLESCIQSVTGREDANGRLVYLEAMVKKDTLYWEIYRQTQPFLILLGDDFCYNILNDMAHTLEHGLLACGQRVELCDLLVDKRQKLVGLTGKCYKAVIGFQSFISNIYLQDSGCYLTDLIYAPKLEMIYDHPFWFYEPLANHGKDFYTLTHDENYVKFIENHGIDISGSYLMPPAGVVTEYTLKERAMDVVFLGTYNNYREKLSGMYATDGHIRRMAARYLKYLRRDVNRPAEEAFAKMLSDFGMESDAVSFSRMMCQMGDVCQCVMYYYREQIVRSLLEAGITLHVYGESWKSSPFMESPYLKWHSKICAQDSRSVLESAKISLNVLAWHKGGCNERIIHSMLAGAVVVTDRSSYIERHFKVGGELFCYDLKALSELPNQVKQLLQNRELLEQVAAAGRKKAIQEYSSKKQAERVLEITEQMELHHTFVGGEKQ